MRITPNPATGLPEKIVEKNGRTTVFSISTNPDGQMKVSAKISGIRSTLGRENQDCEEESDYQCGGDEDAAFQQELEEEVRTVKAYSAKLDRVTVTGKRAVEVNYYYDDIETFNSDLLCAALGDSNEGGSPGQPPLSPAACTAAKASCKAMVEGAYAAAIVKCEQNAQKWLKLKRFGGVIYGLVLLACTAPAEEGKGLANQQCDGMCN